MSEAAAKGWLRRSWEYRTSPTKTSSRAESTRAIDTSLRFFTSQCRSTLNASYPGMAISGAAATETCVPGHTGYQPAKYRERRSEVAEEASTERVAKRAQNVRKTAFRMARNLKTAGTLRIPARGYEPASRRRIIRPKSIRARKFLRNEVPTTPSPNPP